MRDTIYNRVLGVLAVNTTAISANGNTDGASIELDQSGQDFRSVMFVAQMGARTDGTYTLVPQESPTGSVWTDVPAARLLGSGALVLANTIAQMGIIPDPVNFPFVRLRITATVVTTGGTVSAVALVGEGSRTPVR